MLAVCSGDCAAGGSNVWHWQTKCSFVALSSQNQAIRQTRACREAAYSKTMQAAFRRSWHFHSQQCVLSQGSCGWTHTQSRRQHRPEAPATSMPHHSQHCTIPTPAGFCFDPTASRLGAFARTRGILQFISAYPDSFFIVEMGPLSLRQGSCWAVWRGAVAAAL